MNDRLKIFLYAMKTTQEVKLAILRKAQEK